MITKKGPWKVLGSKIVYSNPWIEVVEDQVLKPNKERGIFGVVHMKPGVSVLAVDEEQNVYLTKEYHYAIESDSLEVVSGGIDLDETPLRAARRELKEELGIIADEWIQLGFVDPFTTVVRSRNYMYLAKKLKFENQNLEKTEKIKMVKMRFKKVLELIYKNKITHSGSVALILKARDFLSV